MSDQPVAQNRPPAFHDVEGDFEHISINSAGQGELHDAEITAEVELTKLQDQFQFSDLSHGTRYIYELYEEGFLKVRAWKKKKLVQDFYLALRYLNPTPKVTRIVARRSMKTAAGLLAATALSAIISYLLPYDQLFRSFAILLGSGSLISFMLFLYLTYERIHFFTATGECEVLRLLGSVESFRTCRTIAESLTKAISEAQAQNAVDWSIYLRKEMREHYRLERAEVISHDACSEGTRNILSRFD